MMTFTLTPEYDAEDSFPVSPASYVLALLIGLHYTPETCRQILETCPTIPASSQEMAELCYTKTSETRYVGSLKSLSWVCRDQMDARSALADGFWVIDDHKDNGIQVICCLDDQYPRSLRDLPDYPLVLFVAGDPKVLINRRLIAIVGSREPSEYGKRVSHRLGEFFAERGWKTVSGLALGCDTEAHLGCLEAGGKTVAVLAHGLDHLYPEENRVLAERIISSGGCLVTEYRPHEEPSKDKFIARDRIQAALSRGVIIVESELEGGAMHTARYALQLGRKLGCMGYDREVADAKMSGNDKLVEEGKAVRLVDANDLDRFVALLGE